MIKELNRYTLERGIDISVPKQIESLMDDHNQINVIDYDYVGSANETNYTSFANRLYEYFSYLGVSNFLFISLSDLMNNKDIVVRGYLKHSGHVYDKYNRSIFPINITEKKLVFSNIISIDTPKTFIEIVTMMYSGIYNPGYVLLSSRSPICREEIFKIITTSLDVISGRHGDIKSVHINLGNMKRQLTNEDVSYPYGGTDFGSFMLFTIVASESEM